MELLSIFFPLGFGLSQVSKGKEGEPGSFSGHRNTHTYSTYTHTQRGMGMDFWGAQACRSVILESNLTIRIWAIFAFCTPGQWTRKIIMGFLVTSSLIVVDGKNSHSQMADGLAGFFFGLGVFWGEGREKGQGWVVTRVETSEICRVSLCTQLNVSKVQAQVDRRTIHLFVCYSTHCYLLNSTCFLPYIFPSSVTSSS